MNDRELQFILKMRDEAAAVIRAHRQELRAAGGDAGKLGAEGKKAAISLDQIAKSAKDAAIALGGVAASMRLFNKAKDAFSTLEDGLIQVAKTTGMAGDELRAFEGDLDGLGKRLKGIPVQRIYEIAGAAGQLGIQGRRDLTDFTETMAKLGVATDVVGEQGAKDIARLLTITGDGIGKVKEFGNTLNYLGNRTAASESEILSMASRVGQATTMFKLGSTAILGLSSAMAALDIMPERGGTAMGRVFMQIRDAAMNGGEAMKVLTAITGQTQDQFLQLIQTNPTQALTTFLDAIRQVEASGQSSTGFLELFQLQGIETQAVLGTLANNLDLVKQKITEANEGAKSDSLDDEYAAASQALSAASDGLKNSLQLLLKEGFRPLAPAVTTVMNAIAGALNAANAAFSALPDGIKPVVASLVLFGPAAVGVASAFKLLGPLIGPVLRTIGLIGGASKGAAGSVGILGGALKGLSGAGRSLLTLGASAKNLGDMFVKARLAIAVMAGAMRNVGVLTTIARVALAGLAAVGITVSAPVLAIAAAVAAAVAAVIIFRKQIRDFLALSPKEMVAAIGKGIKSIPSLIGKMWESIKAGFNKVMSWLGDTWNTMWTGLLALKDVDWGALAAAVWDGLKGAVSSALDKANKMLSDWWNSPVWAKGEAKVELNLEMSQEDLDRLRKEHQQAATDLGKKPIPLMLTIDSRDVLKDLFDGPGQREAIEKQKKALIELQRVLASGGSSFDYTQNDLARMQGLVKEAERLLDPVRVRVDELQREADLAGATTAAERNRLEIAHAIVDAEREIGYLTAQQKAQLTSLMQLAQRRRDNTAVEEMLRDYDKQIAQAKAITAEQKNRQEISEALLKLEREHVYVSEEMRKSVVNRIQALQEARKASAFEDTMRSLRDQLATAQAITQEEKNRLAIVQAIAEFERQNGVLDPAKREQIRIQMQAIQQAQQLAALMDRLDPQSAAIRQYNSDVATLNNALATGAINAQQYATMLANLNRQTLAQRDPWGAQLKSMREELELARISGDYREADRRALQTRNQLIDQGVQLSQQQIAQLQQHFRLLQDIEKEQSSGLQGWANGVGSLRDNLLDLTKDFASGLSGAISGAIQGKAGSFRQFLSNLGGRMIETGVNQMLKQAMGSMGLLGKDQGKDGVTAAISQAQASLEQVAVTTPQTVAQQTAAAVQNALASISAASMTVNAGSVTINGQIAGGIGANDNGVPGSGAVGGQGGSSGMGDAVASASSRINSAVAGSVSNAVDLATGMIGKHEVRNQGAVNAFLKKGGVNIDAAQIAWCAGFVNSALKQVGVDGTGSLVATSFRNWGDKVRPEDVMKGDVLVDHRGRRAGQTGGHVGFATGRTRQTERGLELEMLSGNESNQVQRSWYRSDRLDVRRAPGAGMPEIEMAQQQMQQLGQTTQAATTQVQQQVQQASTQMQQFGTTTQASVQQASISMQGANMNVQQLGTSAAMTGQQAMMAAPQVQQGSAALQMVGTSAQQAAPAIQQAGTALQNASQTAAMAGQQAAGAVPGLGNFGAGIQGLLGPLMQAIPGVGQFGGVIMQLVQQLMSGMGGGGGMGGLFGSILGAFFHGGGEVGKTRRPTKAFPVAAFAGAPKFHDGLFKKDEYPAVLQRGERVLTENQNKRNLELVEGLSAKVEELSAGRAAGGGRPGRYGDTNQSITNNIYPRDVDSFRRSQGQIWADTQLKMGRMASRNN